MATQNLNNQWSKIMNTGTFDGETYTGADFDKLVAEYSKRQDGDKVPLMLGTPSENRPEIIGKVDALRRVGGSLEARYANVDPRVEHLRGRGALAKTSVQIKRLPEGDALQRIGLIEPIYDKSFWRDDMTPSLDDLYKQHTSAKDHIFAEAPLSGQWIELFRTGDYGDKGKFIDSDLDQIVRNFDPSFHEPPAVIGHPQHDAPAYGWVDGLRQQGGVLLGKLKQVDPSFEEMVKSGKFKKRSISLYNTAKGWMLRHVGFLGAQPPEVKGLKNATFSEAGIRFVTVEFGESLSADSAIASMKKRGYWLPMMSVGFSELLKAIEGTSLLESVVNMVEAVFDERGIDPGSVRLSRQAQQYAGFHGVSYSEGLEAVNAQHIRSLSGANISGSELSERAQYIAHTRRVDFGEALNLALADDPSLIGPSSMEAKRSGVKLNDRAWEIANAQGIEFGEALAIAVANDPSLQLS